MYNITSDNVAVSSLQYGEWTDLYVSCLLNNYIINDSYKCSKHFIGVQRNSDTLNNRMPGRELLQLAVTTRSHTTWHKQLKATI